MPRITAEDVLLASAGRHWSLTFPPAVERRFEADIGPRRARVLPAVCLRTAFVYNVFLVGDALLARDVFQVSLFLHLAVVTPLILVAALLLRRGLGRTVRNVVVSGIPLAMTAQILIVFALSREPMVVHYQYFVPLVVMYGNVMLRPGIAFAVAVSALVMAAHALACLLHPAMTAEVTVAAVSGLAAASAITLVANFSSERDLRRAFLVRLRENLAAADLKRTAADLARISHIDPLTGMANRRGVDARVDAMFSDADGTAGAFAVLMIDVDHFKGFNDAYGHPEGDRCLSLISQALLGVLREGADIIGRYGGEEFIAVLPKTQLGGGRAVAERMRRAVERLAIPHRLSATGFVTISVGVGAGTLEDRANMDAVVAAADAALYEAKALGRNRVRPERGAETSGEAASRAA